MAVEPGVITGSGAVADMDPPLPRSAHAGLSLVFAPGTRPAAADIEQASNIPVGGLVPFSISHVPEDVDGWLELLAAGLTFDLVGLAPAQGAQMPAVAHRFGPAGSGDPQGEVVTLLPGAHLAGGEALMPVVRAMAGLGASLASLPGVVEVIWHPARCSVPAGQFIASVRDWLAGGAFPAIGLTALVREIDGGMHSEGLAFLVGQEVRLEPEPGESPADSGKILIRLIHGMVEAGAPLAACELTGPAGERLRAEPSGNGRVLRVWRNG